ncbi:hypothetical protein FisN_22Hh059 [Fistulifera solaris]|jgi:hypothetical protein|uniref:Strictosidine synthase conserved region domain-containing protein n=1 Tax=Fistulifera solaris TaxID=1519565 RepID=A0A1Z5K7M2_FISSO|nr:hypothetical protein FisN_22Hh059 [Fistulifera solaris]|eukprot:GAX22270.1 hypothetical protein FisN_22Hh059 [Fistulifera solaris]
MTVPRYQPGSTRLVLLRIIVVMAAVGYFVGKQLHPVLLPYGSPVREPPSRQLPWYTTRSSIAKQYQNALRFKHRRTYKLEAPGIQGSETLFTWRNRLFGLNEQAQLLELTDLPTPAQEDDLLQAHETVWNATSVVHKQLGMGRPLGGYVNGDTLYVADAVLGITQLKHFDKQESLVELITNQVSVLKKLKKRDTHYTQVTSPVLFANSVTVGPITHKIYFTDSTDIPPDHRKEKWDLLYASKLDLLRGNAAGRLCEYNPKTGITRVLAANLQFANGIAVDPFNEDYLIVTESSGLAVLKYHLTSSIKSSVNLLTPEEYLQPEVLVAGLPGYPDNVNCVTDDSTKTLKCYVAIVADVAAIHVAWKALPYLLQNLLRTTLMIVPRAWLPTLPSRYTGILVVDPVSGEHSYLQDPSGKDLSGLTSATVWQDRLYMGSLQNDYVGVYLLSPEGSSPTSDSPLNDKDEL